MRDRYVVANGIRMFCHEGGDPSDPLVLCFHGFPELGWSWRHQVDAIAAHGYHVVAPDLPGYGRTDKPDVAYDVEFLNGTMAALVGALGHDRAVVMGHDWGGILVWNFARQYPELTASVIGVNTPDLARSPVPPIQLLRSIFVDEPIYILQFQERGVAEWVLSWGRGADDFLELMFSEATTVQRHRFGPDVLEVYAQAFRPAGALTPPIEYYRNLDRNWELSAAWDDVPITQPCLMISAANDPVLPPAMTVGMESRVPNLTRLVIDECGHWTQQEQPDQFNEAVLDHLGSLPRW
jgi:pimeloyl-ACP methyl ester carboxylesterase